MEGFTYSNIFDTKGIEYLAIIAFLLLLIPFWIVLNRKVNVGRKVRQALGVLSSGLLRVQRGLFYSGSHTWTHLERSGQASIGLDDLLTHITGEMNFTPLKQNGERIAKGEPLAEFKQGDKSLRIKSPLSGEIAAVNHELTDHPSILAEDPYGKGWLFRVRPTSWREDTSAYCLIDESPEWLQNELTRYKDFLANGMKRHSPGQSLVTLQDGGEIPDHSLASLPAEWWQDFQKEFLDAGSSGS